MKILQTVICVFTFSVLTAASVQAHSPSEHKEKAEKPRCEAMQKMDHSKMNMDDPVRMAMMKKCMKADMEEEGPDRKHNEAAEKHHEDESVKSNDVEHNHKM